MKKRPTRSGKSRYWPALVGGAVGALAAVLVIQVDSGQAAAALRKSGKLVAPSAATLLVFCSDPLIQQVLSQDFRAAGRTAAANAKAPLTLTVTVNQQSLKPGVSLEQVAPGAPQVADLIRAAGTTPPPLGDTGNERDPTAVARQLAIERRRPVDSPMQRIFNQFQGHGELGPPVPCNQEPSPQPGCFEPTPKPQPDAAGYTGDVQDYMHRTHPGQPFYHDNDKAYDTVVVARASLSGSADELTVVAVIHPGDEVDDAKKLVGEEIANAVLH